ncbi:MAG: hypothetical protein GYA86_08365 [Firmicutes bacterium]|jgi:hypothetical protein|nr:hypothetical protein [Bacillota bacterium]
MRATMRNVGKAEFMHLFHQYQAESLCGKKLQSYSTQVQDPRLRNLINEFNTQCQQRAQWLSATLSDAGGSPYITP